MYKLNILGYSEGTYSEEKTVTSVDIELDDRDEFPNVIDLSFTINKVGSELFIKTRFHTTAVLSCDRCLEPFDYELDDSMDIICTNQSDLYENNEDDVYPITDSTQEVDITESIRQSMLTSIPFKQVCDANCKGLCSHCGANLNTEKCDCDTDTIDPRWEALKKLR